MNRFHIVFLIVLFPSTLPAEDYSNITETFNRVTQTFVMNEETWVKEYFSKLRNPQRLKKYVGKILSLQQKVEIVVGVFKKDYAPDVESLFKTSIADGEKLSTSLHKRIRSYEFGFVKLHKSIRDELKKTNAKYKGYVIPPNRWDKAFDGTIAVAKHAAKNDLARYVATFAGGALASDGLYDLSKKYGFWQPKENSWADSAGRMALELVADTALDMVSDPTNEIVKRLDAELAKVEKHFLTSPDGYMAQIKRLAKHQRQFHLRYIWPLKR